jgi:hypothetical protein
MVPSPRIDIRLEELRWLSRCLCCGMYFGRAVPRTAHFPRPKRTGLTPQDSVSDGYTEQGGVADGLTPVRLVRDETSIDESNSYIIYDKEP